ncbi:hypothetical protein QCA50_003860 [Cerrena zonata]|uniref:Uncharacterized protein n=1 Tax=Cerrena zonata TaxID=2478898 RepID=A0AAW0GFX7_9APHY
MNEKGSNYISTASCTLLAAGASSVNVLQLNKQADATSLGSFSFDFAAKQANLNLDPNNLQGMTIFVKQ